MSSTVLKTRIQHKNDTTENWAKATNFIPLAGELIVYNTTPPQVKIGDGVTLVGNLPFIKAGSDTTITPSLTSGTKIGSISIDGTSTDLYAPSTITWANVTSKPSYYDAKAIKSITRSGTTFTYTCLDGTTGTFTQQDNNTTYAVFVKSGSGAQAGLVPAPSTTAGTTKYLREDGTWTVPPDTNTTYSAATTSANGLMTAAMVTKLNGIATGANAYSLPAATASTLGGVKVGSNITVSSGTISLTKANVTAALGYTPPTSDTNTEYSAGSQLSLSGTTFSVNQQGSYVSNTAYESLPKGISYIEMPATATVSGDPTYGTCLTVYLNTSRAFQLVGTGDGHLYIRGLHLNNSSDAGTGYSAWSEVAKKADLSDTKVTQSSTSASNYRPILLGYTSSTDTSTLNTTVTNQAYVNTSLYVKPSTGALYATSVYGAVWNDYAEFRTTVPNVKPGQVIIENGDGTLRISTERLQPGCEVVSDTFGFAIGETDECKTPIAAAGRVLAYTYEDRNEFIAGEPVCSGPNGTVSRMTLEEARLYPHCIIGTVSEIPSYERWGTGDVEVDGRIWIRIR